MDKNLVRRELDAARLMQEARQQSGLSDFGDEAFVPALDKLLSTHAGDCDFHAVGVKLFRDEVVRNLVNRLRFQDDLKRHPEILDEDISDPIIIIGLPRSGTTKTQRMMGMDSALLKTHVWELMNPAPFSNAVAGQRDPRIAAASIGSHMGEDTPEIQAAHSAMAESVDEDWQLFEFTLNEWYQNGRTPSRGWHEWILSRTEPSNLDNYRYVHSLFQYLQWQHGGRRNRRWLMKSCGHLPYMDELLTVFPRATLMHVHRHPATSLASLCKIMLEFWRLRLNDVDPAFVGGLMFDWAKNAMDKYLEARDRLQLDARILDVRYDSIRDEPMSVFREVYRRAGIAMSGEAEQAMLLWDRENEQGKHGAHVYSLELFSLSEKKIDDAFGEYIHRFVRH